MSHLNFPGALISLPRDRLPHLQFSPTFTFAQFLYQSVFSAPNQAFPSLFFSPFRLAFIWATQGCSWSTRPWDLTDQIALSVPLNCSMGGDAVPLRHRNSRCGAFCKVRRFALLATMLAHRLCQKTLCQSWQAFWFHICEERQVQQFIFQWQLFA